MELAYPFFWEAVLLTIGLFEAARAQAGWNVPGRQSAVDQMKADYEPGNLGFDPLGLYPRDERAQYEIGTKEARRPPAASRLLPRPAARRRPRCRPALRGAREGVPPPGAWRRRSTTGGWQWWRWLASSSRRKSPLAATASTSASGRASRRAAPPALRPA